MWTIGKICPESHGKHWSNVPKSTVKMEQLWNLFKINIKILFSYTKIMPQTIGETLHEICSEIILDISSWCYISPLEFTSCEFSWNLFSTTEKAPFHCLQNVSLTRIRCSGDILGILFFYFLYMISYIFSITKEKPEHKKKIS